MEIGGYDTNMISQHPETNAPVLVLDMHGLALYADTKVTEEHVQPIIDLSFFSFTAGWLAAKGITHDDMSPELILELNMAWVEHEAPSDLISIIMGDATTEGNEDEQHDDQS